MRAQSEWNDVKVGHVAKHGMGRHEQPSEQRHNGEPKWKVCSVFRHRKGNAVPGGGAPAQSAENRPEQRGARSGRCHDSKQRGEKH